MRLAWVPMAGGHLAIPLAVATEQLVGAGSSIAIAAAIAFAFDHVSRRSGPELAQAALRGQLSPEADTRLRFVRRLVVAVILVAGIAIALSQFAGINRVATSLLASGAIAAAVIGFAARQTLANLVAGFMLAITQPVRVGDWVTFDEQHGEVEDVRLNYTILRTGSDQRVIIPNEKLASGIMRNDTLGSNSIGLDVDVWLPPFADEQRATEVLEAETGHAVAVAEQVPWGTRLAIGSDPCPPPERAAREAELRARCLRRLRAEGLLPHDGDPAGSRDGADRDERGRDYTRP
jgi:small-conductance mechanosensitive channel